MSEALTNIAFGPFRLDVEHRQLCRGGEKVALSSRAFDILVLLVTQRGRVVTKDEIMSQVWRGMIVEENNLAVQISALRRALAEGADGAQMIMTIPGQGYRFVAPVAEAQDAPRAKGPDAPRAAVTEAVDRPTEIGPPPAWRAWLAHKPTLVAILLLAMASLRFWVPQRPAAPPAPRLSIAVLPFRDLSDDRCCDYLADAISDDLTTDLSHIPGSVVIARESSDAFRGHAVPTAQIGRALNVRYLLEGSLRGVENRFSINAQLIEAATGGHLWAERFEVPRDHLAEAQTAIVRRLASALGVTLVDIEGSASLRERGNKPDALDFFLRARSILDRSDTLESMTEAQHLLEQAVAKQPGFTEAQAALAWLLPRKISGVAYPTQAADLAEARATVQAALYPAPGSPAATGPGVALALAAKGALLYHDGKCGEAATTYRAALALQPDSIEAQTGLTVCEAALGHFAAAVAGLQDLMRIDPESPRNKARTQQMGFALLMLNRPADAADWLDRSLSGDPEPAPGANDLGRVEWAHVLRIAALELAGDHAGAVEHYQTYVRIWPYRTAWQLGSEFTRAQSTLPAFGPIVAAWEKAGMPAFADEHADLGVPDTGTIVPHRAIEPTPARPANLPTYDTPRLAALLRASAKPMLIDFGGRAAVPEGAQTSDADPLAAADMQRLAHDVTDAAGSQKMPQLVVMGRGPFDWTAINAARQLQELGVTDIAWYRGGEEAWARAGLPYADKRDP